MHAPQGSTLSIYEILEPVEYYIISYIAPTAHAKQYHTSFSNGAILEEHLHALNLACLQQNSLNELRKKALFYHFIYDFLQQYQMAKTANTAHLASIVMQYIEQNYALPLTRESIAEYFNYNKTYLAKRFKQQTGQSLIDYVIFIRIKKAKKLLRYSNLSLTTIAKTIGYEDSAYFTRIFKKSSGQTPTQYRQQYPISPNVSHCPTTTTTYSNDWPAIWRYIDNGYQLIREDNIQMKKFTQLASTTFLLCTLLLLGACSQQASQEVDSDNNTNDETVVYQSTKGDITIPKNPQRIVTDYYAGHLLTLGVKPVGTFELYLQSPYLEGKVDDIALIEDSVEKIVDLNPDLIITGDAEKYDAYSKIAPTIFITVIDASLEDTVKEFGKILNKADEAEAWLTQYHERVAAAKKQVATVIKPDQTVTVVDSGSGKGEVALYGNGFTGRSFYSGLALNAPQAVTDLIDPEKAWVHISKEVLNDYVGDYLFVAVDKSVEPIKYDEDIEWRNLSATKNDELYEVDGYRFWFSDPISLLGQIESIADIIVNHDTGRQ